MSKDEAYLSMLRANSALTAAYHTKSVVKTEQQKDLERLLNASGVPPSSIADLACGGGALSHHLKALYPQARFTLCDLDPVALGIARKLNGEDGFTYGSEDLNLLTGLADNSFDLVCCWQTLLALVDAQTAIRQMLRITKPGGRIFASSLFNLDHDVDLRTQLRDHTLPSGAQGQWVSYNTFSRRTVAEWLDGHASAYELHRFTPGIDIHNTGNGLGTFTVNGERGRLQISGGFLMNWAILEIVK
ncbi:MAG: class I SAM-dependent methyltransferase [Flavobacteriales bacterium]